MYVHNYICMWYIYAKEQYTPHLYAMDGIYLFIQTHIFSVLMFKYESPVN